MMESDTNVGAIIHDIMVYLSITFFICASIAELEFCFCIVAVHHYHFIVQCIE